MLRLSNPENYQKKEALYLQARQLEGRVLEDAVVKSLPDVTNNPHTREWKWRKRSFDRLQKYLDKRFSLPNCAILDLGCGNGWMSNKLAKHSSSQVWAADVNMPELEQGARLFGRDNLRFVYADVLEDCLPENYFDVVVLAASAQYFPDLGRLLASLRRILKQEGEIHIIDTQFYPSETARTAARQRTFDYYRLLGVPEMAAYYHHHLWSEAQKLGAKQLFNGLIPWILRKIRVLSPFPWVYFKKS